TGCGIISIGRYRHQTPKRTDSTTPGTTTASLALATPRSWQQRSHYESSSHHTYSQRVEADHEPASPFWWRSAVFAVASGRRGESIVGGSPSSQSRFTHGAIQSCRFRRFCHPNQSELARQFRE